MKSYSSTDARKSIIRFLIKSVITTIASILLYSLIFSEVIYKLDIDMDYNSVFSLFIVFTCSATISFISVLSLKNNGAVMGILSIIPLVFYSLINLIINENSWIMFFIKLAIAVFTSALFGILATKKTNKLKV